MGNKKKVLDICERLPITQHTVHAIPLSIILSDNQHFGWLYQNFVQVCSSIKQDSNIKQRMYYYGMNYAAYGRLLSITQRKEFDKTSDIVEHIIKFIDDFVYVSVYMDMFFVKEKESAHGRHYSQKVLIFGYDSDKRAFYVKGYNQNALFSTFIIGYEELSQAFEAGRVSAEDGAGSFYIETYEFTGYGKPIEFSLERYKCQLNDYLYSKTETEEIQQNENYLKKIRFVGMDAYRDFEAYIETAIEEGYDIPYHDFHLFYEHRKLNLDRFIYINQTCGVSIFLDGYSGLVERCARLRFSYMKNAIKQGSLYARVRDRELMMEYKRRMHLINSEEAEILAGIEREI